MRRTKRAGRWAMASGWPEDAWRQCARATLLGKRCVMIEGHCGVVELNGNRIRLKTKEGLLAVCGEKLHLQEMSLDAAMISGERIESVSYL